jgi:hypothetical protein
MERHKHLNLDPFVRKRVMSASAATIDRLLAKVKQHAGQRKRRRKRNYMGSKIPTRTFSDWKPPAPGYLEIDFVEHCGSTMPGSYIHSLYRIMVVILTGLIPDSGLNFTI